jgi:hypothetical protein
MKRRLAAGLVAVAALGGSMLMTAPAMADPGPGYDAGYTRVEFDAGPEPVRAGHRLHLGGKLSVRCDEDFVDGFVVTHNSDLCQRGADWHRLGRKPVVILFRPDGSGRWEHVDTVRTRRGGEFHTSVTARTSGTWRAVFEGARYLGPAEATDWVKVHGR